MFTTIHIVLVKCVWQWMETIKTMVRAQTIIIKGILRQIYEDVKLLRNANLKYYSSAMLSTNSML